MLLKFALPYCAFLIFFAINLVDISFNADVIIKIPAVLMGVFYWSVYRPKIVPVWFVFLLGIGLDIFMLTPMGLNALIFLVVQWFTRDQRFVLMGQQFWAFWVGFTIVLLGATLLELAVMHFIMGRIGDILTLCANTLSAVLIFPIVIFLLGSVNRMLPMHGFSLGFKG